MPGTARARAIALLAAAGLLAGCGFFAYRSAVRLRQNLGPLLLAQLRAHLGPGISIGGVDFRTPGILKLTRVRVADPIRRGGQLAEATQIVARYRLGDLLFGARDAAGAVERIEIDGLKLRLARAKQGEWNFQRLLRTQPTRPPTRFRGMVVIRGGRAEVSDYAAPGGQRLIRTTLQGLAATVSARDMPRLLFAVEGRVNGRGGTAAVQGYYRDDTKAWLGRLSARGLDAAHWLGYFSRPGELRVEGGRADVQFLATADGPKRQPEGEGKIRLRQATLRVPGLARPLTEAEIELAGTRQILGYRGRGRLAGAPVRFWGDSLPGLTPDFRLRFRAAPVGLQPVREVFPTANLPATIVAEGPVEIEGEVAGHGAAVAVTGKARVAALAYEGVRAVRATAEWRSVGKVVEVSHFAAQALGGRVEGQGWVTPGPEKLAATLRCTLENLDLSQLPRPAQTLSGTASGEVVIQGSVDDLRGTGSLRAANLRLGKASVAEATARFTYAEGKIGLRDAVIADPRGSARLSGSIDPAGPIALEVDITIPELQRVAEALGQEAIAGEGRFRGRITGTAAEARVEGKVRVLRPRWREVELDLLEATLLLDPKARQVVLTGARAVQLPAVATAERIEVTQDSHGRLVADGAAALGPLSVAHLIRLGGGEPLLRREPVAGTITGMTASFCGPVDALEVELEGSAEGVAVRGLMLGQVTGALQADLGSGEVRVRSLSARHGAQELRAEGGFTLRGPAVRSAAEEAPVSLTLTAAHLPVLPLARRFAPQLVEYATLDTSVRALRLSVSGSDRGPVVQGQLETTRVTLNGLGFEPLQARIGWRPGVVVVSGLSLAGEQGGRLSIPALAWLYPEEIPERPDELLSQVLGAVRLEALPLASAKRLIQESPFSRRPEAAPLLAGLQHLKPPIRGELDIDLEFPCSIAAAAELDGSARAAALAERRRRPLVAMRIGIPDLSLMALYDEAEAGNPQVRPVHVKVEARLAYQQERVDISRLLIDQIEGDAQVTARGWCETNGDDDGRADRIQVELDAVNLPLSALARLPFERLNHSLRPLQPLTGMAEVHAVATGNARAPNVQLSASIDNLRARGYSLSALNADQVEVSAEEGKLRLIDVDLVQRHANHTHRVRLGGEVPFSWSLPGIVPTGERDLTITAAAQSLDVLNDLAAPQHPGAARQGMLAELGVTGGTIEAQVRLQGTADSPRNSGAIHLRGGRVRLGKGETALENLMMDLKFIGTEVRVERCTGQSHRSGAFQVTGRVLLGKATNDGPSAELDLGLEISQFRFVEERLGQIDPALKGTTVRGTLQTVDTGEGRDPQAIRITGPWTRPTVRGALRLNQAASGVPAGLTGAAPAGKLLIDPRLDLRLFIGDDVGIKNPMVDMRLKGMVAVTNTLSAPVVAGRVNIPRGTLQLPTMRFRTDGFIRIAYDGRPAAGGAAPPAPVYLELRGVTHARRRETEAGPAEDVQIIMTVRGWPSGAGERGGRDGAGTSLSGKFLLAGTEGLTVEFSSDPPLPYPQVASLIRHQMGVEGIYASEANLQTVLRSQVQLALANSIAPMVTSRIEDYVQRALGLDTFAIDVGAPEQPLQLRAGKRIFAGLYGSFAQQLGTAGESRRSYELYYRLSRGLRAGLRQEDTEQRQLFFLSGSKRFR